MFSLKITLHSLYEPGQSILFFSPALIWTASKTDLCFTDHFDNLMDILSASKCLLSLYLIRKSHTKLIPITHRNEEIELRLPPFVAVTVSV